MRRRDAYRRVDADQTVDSATGSPAKPSWSVCETGCCRLMSSKPSCIPASSGETRAGEAAGHAESGDAGWAKFPAAPATEPEVRFTRDVDPRLLREALDALPAEFREALVLRELEGFSYKEIADIANVPLGTVMSRLARARRQLQRSLLQRMKEGV